MSYFGTTLKELLQRKGMKAVRLAELSNVSQPTVSRYIRGDQTWVSPDDLVALAEAISNDPKEQAELIRAHLLDECKGPGSQLIDIRIDNEPGAGRPMPSQAFPLPEDLEQCFTVLRQWVIKDRNVREVVEGLGALLTSGAHGIPDPEVEEAADRIEQEAIQEILNSRETSSSPATSRKRPRRAASGPAAPAPAPNAPTALHRSRVKKSSPTVPKQDETSCDT